MFLALEFVDFRLTCFIGQICLSLLTEILRSHSKKNGCHVTIRMPLALRIPELSTIHCKIKEYLDYDRYIFDIGHPCYG